MINKSNQLIGLSLSFCVSDILTKQVELDNVLKLYTSCLWKSEQELEDLLKKYHELHWNQFELTEVKKVFNSLLPKISMTQRLAPPRCPNSFEGHWVTNESDISWHIYNKKLNRWMLTKPKK